MPTRTYVGGVSPITFILPSGPVDVATGETVELTDADIVQLGEHPDWAADELPDGSVQDVLAWVGDDAERAGQALAAERAGKERSSLIEKLEQLSAPAESGADEASDNESQED